MATASDAPERHDARRQLIGLMVDVSGSMLSSIQNPAGPSRNRLEGFRDAFDEFVERGSRLSRKAARDKRRLPPALFSYGFGFGGPLALLLGGGRAGVRDLLDIRGPSPVPIDELALRWGEYRDHVESMSREMFGDTPMAEAFSVARRRIHEELATGRYDDQPILFVLSDGEPTDASPAEVARAARELKDEGVVIVSCFVTDQDLTEPRLLYGEKSSTWPDGAQLMFECASALPARSPFASYLTEYRWRIDAGAQLFTQINRSDILSEFMNVVLSPLESESDGPSDPISVFVSYSHRDSKYLRPDSLLGFLAGLENEGFEFWSDERIVTSELWDERIRSQIERSDVALALVSQAFLNSRYCQEVEIAAFLRNRRDAGLRIFPVIVAPCDWTRHAWLAATQFQPRGGKTIERDYRSRGSRDGLFLEILRELRTLGDDIRGRRASPAPG
jgi:hypothetical protein